MTDDEKALDKASKHSALAVLGMAAVTSIALLPSLFVIPLVSIPLWALGALQRFTERPWFAAGAAAWGVGIAVYVQSPAIGVASAVGGYFFVRHFRLMRKLRLAADPQARPR